MICSNETLLEKELKHLKHVFHKTNRYSWWDIDQVSPSIQGEINKSKSSEYYPDTSKQPFEKYTLWSCHMLDLKVTLLSKQRTIA